MYKRLFVILSLALAGCTVQKATLSADVRTAETEMRHHEALKALETRKFIIKADEFYLRPGEAPVSSPGSYLFLQGERGVIRFEQKVLPYASYDLLYIEDAAAQIKTTKIRKNGDVEFLLKIKQPKEDQSTGKMLLVLYAHTNKCAVVRGNGRSDMRFTGYIYPYDEELHK